MNDLVIFIYESGICLAVLFALYWLFLRKETYFRFNRFYLLGTIVVACMLPLGNLNLFGFGSEVSSLNVIPRMVEAIRIPELTITEGSNNIINPPNKWQLIAFVIYLIGVSLLLTRIILGIIKVTMLKRQGRVIYLDGYSIVHIKQEIAPFSFFKTIFINDTLIESSDKSYIISHEIIHIKQLHTYDNLFVEFFLAIFWFNPFMWFLKGALRNTHEYLADNGVLNETTSQTQYQALLLKQISGLLPFVVTNSFNSAIKNRIKMMCRNKSSVLAKLKPLLLVPMLACLTLIFACSEKPKDLTVDNSQNESAQEDIEIIEPIEVKDDSQKESVIADSESVDPVVEENEIQKESVPEDREIFYIVEEMPTFNGGEAGREFRNYIAQNLQYPEMASKNGIAGRVIVQFVINKKGDLVDAKIVRSADPALDKEAIRVVMSSPEWTPGKQNGKEVEVLFTFPINFVLE